MRGMGKASFVQISEGLVDEDPVELIVSDFQEGHKAHHHHHKPEAK